MLTNYHLKLNGADIMQILDALEIRKQTWEETLNYSNGDKTIDFTDVIEDYSSNNEIESILQHYKSIINTIRIQIQNGRASSF